MAPQLDVPPVVLVTSWSGTEPVVERAWPGPGARTWAALAQVSREWRDAVGSVKMHAALRVAAKHPELFRCAALAKACKDGELDADAVAVNFDKLERVLDAQHLDCLIDGSIFLAMPGDAGDRYDHEATLALVLGLRVYVASRFQGNQAVQASWRIRYACFDYTHRCLSVPDHPLGQSKAFVKVAFDAAAESLLEIQKTPKARIRNVPSQLVDDTKSLLARLAGQCANLL